MRDLLNLIRSMLLGLFRSKSSLEAEILALRHQLNVLRRASPQRPVFSNFDRMILVCLYRIAPRILDALAIVEPETVIRSSFASLFLRSSGGSGRITGHPSLSCHMRPDRLARSAGVEIEGGVSSHVRPRP